jgi:CheY-like chemotaxis protein
MKARQKILVLDDENDWLDVCREFLERLPSKPEIVTVSSGMSAWSLLNTQPFHLLLCDLRMPRVDGLQVLSLVRRRFPELRTVALTGFADEGFRSRAYALGVDLFWLKLDMQQNPQMFLECIESLLGQKEGGGGRDVQSTNLLDAIQMELALRNSSALRVTSGQRVAHIWVRDGQLIDAQAEGADGEDAFWRILKWKSSAFESLPAEPGHIQTITKSLTALLLESAQTVKKAGDPTPEQEAEETKFVARLTAVAYEGAEFVVTVPANNDGAAKGWGIRDVDRLAAWARITQKTALRLGEKFNAGPLKHITGHNLEKHLLLMRANGRTFVIGWPPEADPRRLFEQSINVADTWAS